MKYTKAAQDALNAALMQARDFGHTYVGSEHLLLGILYGNTNVAARLLENRGITFEIIKEKVSASAGTGDKSGTTAAEMTPRTKSIIERSSDEARSLGHNYIGTEHILMALLRESDSMALKLLMSAGANINLLYNDILSFFSSKEYATGQPLPDSGQPPSGAGTKSGPPPQTPTLNQYGRDLTAAARSGKLDPIIGRDTEMERVVQILSRRTKNNPCLIGEPGVGKTAVVEGLAQKIVEGNVPDTLIGKRLVTLDISAMIAGAKYRGEFEERLKNVMEEIRKNPDVIIFIDEMHTIIGAGAAEGAVDAANILKPALARGDMQVIGATTFDEYRKYIEKDAALERRFQRVTVGEPSEAETVQILRGLRDRYEAHHKVKINDEAIEAAVSFATRYITDRFLPDKAIDLIDEAASKLRIGILSLPPELRAMEDEIKRLDGEKEEAVRSQDFERAAGVRDSEKQLIEKFNAEKEKWMKQRDTAELSISVENIADIVTQWTSIPVKQLLKEEAERLINLEEVLRARIIGQDEAVSAVARAIRRSRVGLKDPNRPAGSFIFLGPTGVGKTELCRALAWSLFGSEEAMIRVDMSEFMEKHSVSKLIGSPPGYVGYDDGGQITEKIRRKPYSIVLFDEIEKAHPDVFNILLQILEDGALTDSHGRKADFKNAIIIMTSNVGAAGIIDNRPLGFTSQSGDEYAAETQNKKIMDSLKGTFRPEFLNRVDEIIVFHKLGSDELKKITVNMLDILKERVKAMGIDISFDDACVEWLAKEGYDPVYGARPLRRAIQRTIEDALSVEMLEGRITEGKSVSVTLKDGKPAFSV